MGGSTFVTPCEKHPDRFFPLSKLGFAAARHDCRAHCPLARREDCHAKNGADKPGELSRARVMSGVVGANAYGDDMMLMEGQPAPTDRYCPTCLSILPKPTKAPVRRGLCGQPAGWSSHVQHGEHPCKTCDVAIRIADIVGEELSGMFPPYTGPVADREPRSDTYGVGGRIAEIEAMLDADVRFREIVKLTGCPERTLRHHLADNPTYLRWRVRHAIAKFERPPTVSVAA